MGFSPVQSTVTIKSLGRFTTPTKLFQLKGGEVAAIELYIWLEGQDADCSRDAGSSTAGTLVIRLELAGESEADA